MRIFAQQIFNFLLNYLKCGFCSDGYGFLMD